MRRDLSATAIDHRLSRMNAALPGALEAAPDELVASMPVNDKDRHVLALAVQVEAPTIITYNLRDFPDHLCGQVGVEAISPDEFLVRVAQLDAPSMLEALGQIAGRRRRPPTTVLEILRCSGVCSGNRHGGTATAMDRAGHAGLQTRTKSRLIASYTVAIG